MLPDSTATTSLEGDGDAIEVCHHVENFVAATKDEAHQCRHIVHGDFSVTIDISIRNDEVVIVCAQDMAHEECHVGH